LQDSVTQSSNPSPLVAVASVGAAARAAGDDSGTLEAGPAWGEFCGTTSSSRGTGLGSFWRNKSVPNGVHPVRTNRSTIAASLIIFILHSFFGFGAETGTRADLGCRFFVGADASV